MEYRSDLRHLGLESEVSEISGDPGHRDVEISQCVPLTVPGGISSTSSCSFVLPRSHTTLHLQKEYVSFRK